MNNRPIPLTSEISDEFLKNLLDRFEDTMSLGNIHDRRELLSHVVEKIEIGERIGKTRSRELVMEARVTPLKVGDPSGN